MPDLTLFSENPKSKGDAIAPTSKKRGGALSRTASSGKGTLAQTPKPPAPTAQIKQIDATLGAGFSAALLERVGAIAQEWEQLYSQAEQIELALILGAEQVQESARVSARQKAQLQISYRNLCKLKSDALAWLGVNEEGEDLADSPFEDYLANLCKLGLGYPQIQTFAVQEAAKFHIKLELAIAPDGSYTYDYAFEHEDELAKAKSELERLGIDV